MKDGLLKCSKICMFKHTDCPNSECKHWIDYKKDHNCTLIAVYNHGPLTLREAAERLKISFARVKQIESAALAKLKKKKLIRSLLF